MNPLLASPSFAPLDTGRTELARLLIGEPLAEKWVLAPSLRIGRQWLDRIAQAGHPLLNVHVMTLNALALRLAQPAMNRLGLTPLSSVGALFLVEQIWDAIPEPEREYLLRAPASPSLIEGAWRALMDLRLAGLSAEDLQERAFETGAKGRDMVRLLMGYGAALEQNGLADHAWRLQLALQEMHGGGAVIEERDIRLFLPSDLEFKALEQALIDAIPADRRSIVPMDDPLPLPDVPPATNLALLRCLDRPDLAPPPLQPDDGSVTLFQAIGEVNEAREVFRRILAAGRRLDEVEVVCTDKEAYVPLFYELACRFAARDGVPGGATLPATFADGVPARYGRPARALAGWVRWMREGCPQEGLARMIEEGLLNVGDGEGDGATDAHLVATAAALAEELRTLPVYGGWYRYLPQTDKRIESLEDRLRAGAAWRDEDGESDGVALDALRRRLERTRALRGFLERVMDVTARTRGAEQDILEAARHFLNTLAQGANELDNYVRVWLIQDIDEYARWQGADPDGGGGASDPTDRAGDGDGADALQWLERLPAQGAVQGMGPQPGRLHVSAVRSGGHSGRPLTFIVGLDDGRYPGGGRQDPILLDSERHGLSPRLPTSASLAEEREREMRRLLGRLRGAVVLSAPCWNVQDDRDQFPSSLLLAAHRLVAGAPEADYESLKQAMGPPVSFAPNGEGDALSENEWWLAVGCRREPPPNLSALVENRHPHLARGRQADWARDSDRFTAFDGAVPEAGRPFATRDGGAGPALSSSALECLGACPLRYFFRSVLRLRPPEDLELDRRQWLDAPTYGSLVHAILRDFMAERIACDEPVDGRPEQAEALTRIAADRLAEIAQDIPPPSRDAQSRLQKRLAQTMDIFLSAERAYQAHPRTGAARPTWVEVSLGMAPGPDEGVALGGADLDDAEPVPIALPDGRTLRARGRIDRIDCAAGPDGDRFFIWDYKTGSSRRYETKQAPFNEGRIVQNVLYAALARTALARRGRPVVDIAFGYFFPSERAWGKRIQWDWSALAPGLDILAALCDLAAAGAFVGATSEDDCRYCDYNAICDDPGLVAWRNTIKASQGANACLAPLRRLRGLEAAPSPDGDTDTATGSPTP